MNNDRDEPMAPIAGALISTKRDLERANLLSTKRFEGFGMKENNDPVERLRQLVKGKYQKRENKIVKHDRNQSGGAIPALLIPVIASVIGSLAGRVYDTIRDKIQGKGYDLPDLKTKQEKHDYVLKLIKHI